MKNILLTVSMLLPVLVSAQKNAEPKTFDLVVGTYTSGKSKGISVYRFYAETGRLAYLNQVTGVSNPSYLCVSGDNKFVYATNENDSGEVSAFSFDAKTGTMKFINKQSSLGGAPCYVSIDKAQKNLFVANYSGGNITVLPLNTDGSIAPAAQTIRDNGHGPDKNRQEKAHVHTAVLSPDEKYVLYTDLGTDKINITKYRRSESNPIIPAAPPYISVAPGAGPRHLAFAPDKKHLYLITEMGSNVVVFDYENGKAKQKQSVTLLQDGFTGKTGAADIHLTPDGKFLYATNRGDANDISVFSVNAETGMLTFIERKSSNGKAPRNFAIDPTGNFLVLANQDSDDIYVFRINKDTGRLTDTHSRTEIGNPVCLQFTPAL